MTKADKKSQAESKPTETLRGTKNHTKTPGAPKAEDQPTNNPNGASRLQTREER